MLKPPLALKEGAILSAAIWSKSTNMRVEQTLISALKAALF